MQILKNRAFSIIEILIVIVIVVVFVVIAYPQVTNYLTDREVKKEVDSFVEYFEEKKSTKVVGDTDNIRKLKLGPICKNKFLPSRIIRRKACSLSCKELSL